MSLKIQETKPNQHFDEEPENFSTFWRTSMTSEEPKIFIGNSDCAKTAHCLYFSRSKKCRKPKKVLWVQTARNSVILTY